MMTPEKIAEIKESMKALPTRKLMQVESSLRIFAAEISEQLQRGVTRKNIRDLLVSHGIKLSPSKFKEFLDQEILPTLPKTSAEVFKEIQAKAGKR